MSRASAKRLWAGFLLISSLCTDISATGQETVETSRPDGIVKFETKVHVVLVPVLVLDREGHAVGNLTQRDFRIFDKGKAQVISGFTVERRASTYAETKSTSSAISSAIPGQTSVANSNPRRFVAFVFDDVHLSSQELVHVRSAATRMLSESLISTDAAAVLSTSGRTNTGFTHDRAKLQAAILSLRPAPSTWAPELSVRV